MAIESADVIMVWLAAEQPAHSARLRMDTERAATLEETRLPFSLTLWVPALSAVMAIGFPNSSA